MVRQRIYLSSEDRHVWSEKIDDEENPYLKDLVGLTGGYDPFTRWIFFYLITPYHRLIGRFFKVFAQLPVSNIASLMQR